MKKCPKCGLVPDLCLCSLIEAEDKRIKKLAQKIPSWLQVHLRKRIIRLLLMRAGGNYQTVEAGMIYQCLNLLGVPPYRKRKQIDDLIKVTCRSLTESDARKQLIRLLKVEKHEHPSIRA